MERGVSPAQIRSNAFGCIPINLSGMQTRHGMKLLVIGDHRSNRRAERERRTPPRDRIIRRRGWRLLMDTRRERERERTFWKFYVHHDHPPWYRYRGAVPFDPRLNTAALLMLPAGRRGIIPPWKSTNRDYAGLNWAARNWSGLQERVIFWKILKIFWICLNNFIILRENYR